MAPFLALPNELLLDIARYFKDDYNTWSNDLYNLSFTCRRLRPIAQEVLHYYPALPRRWLLNDRAKRRRALFCLVRTLLNRRDLASKVRCLDITSGYTCTEVSSDSAFGDILKLGTSVINSFERKSCKVCRSLPYLSLEEEFELGCVCRGHDWAQLFRFGRDAAWIGVLLAIVPNLEELTIEFLNPDNFDSTGGLHYMLDSYEANPLESMFGSSYPDDSIDLSILPGLQKLRRLFFSGGHIDSQWTSLPSLDSLRMYPECRYLDQLHPTSLSDDNSTPSPVQSLELECSTWSFVDMPPPQIQHRVMIPGFFHGESFPNMKYLLLYFRNGEINPNWNEDEDDFINDILTQNRRGSCATLIDRLQTFSPMVEALYINIWNNCCDPSFLDFLDPLRSVAHFTALKHFVVPQELLLGHGYGTPSQAGDPLPITQILPGSLESLSIQAPDLNICYFLEELLENRKFFRKLVFIEFHCFNCRGHIYPVINCVGDPMWRKLRANGISVWSHYREEDVRPEWWDGTWADEEADMGSDLIDFIQAL